VKILFEYAAQTLEISYGDVGQTCEIRQDEVSQTFLSGIHKGITGNKYLVNSS